LEHLEKLIESKDGMWRGFQFPGPVQMSDRQFPFPVDASYAKFASLDFTKVQFGAEVKLTAAHVAGNFGAQGTTFQGNANFDRCQFDSDVTLQHVKFNEQSSFHRAEFRGRVFLRVYFLRRTNFSSTIFHRAVHFAGWRNISIQLSSAAMAISAVGTLSVAGGTPLTLLQRTRILMSRLNATAHAVRRRLLNALSKAYASIDQSVKTIRRRYARSSPNVDVFDVFGDEAEMTSVEFASPTQVTFTNANLSKAYFRGTNLRGARFYAVNWHQPELGRNGLYDEIFIAKSQDGAFRYQHLPLLEETCRNLRAALEDSRNYAEAADFYIGEMEARRAKLGFLRRHLFSVEALYRYASDYGASVGKALAVLLVILMLHAALTIHIQNKLSWWSLDAIESTMYRSFQLPFFRTSSIDHDHGPALQRWIDLFFRTFAIIQIALVVFAFRARIKRH
jgi:uncharacterized protein YjbI with pentapeptide repeats